MTEPLHRPICETRARLWRLPARVLASAPLLHLLTALLLMLNNSCLQCESFAITSRYRRDSLQTSAIHAETALTARHFASRLVIQDSLQGLSDTADSLSSPPTDTSNSTLALPALPTSQASLQSTASTAATASSIPISLSNKPQATSLLHAAAIVTQTTCPLLGVKSLGVDYGLVRTGMALTVGYNPQPLTILSDYNNTQLCEIVCQTALTHQVDRIIVGLPLHKNGTVAEQTNLTRVFARELTIKALAALGPRVLVQLWDERYTSKEAAARAHARDPNLALYGMLDAEAACIILEHYYHDNGVGAQVIEIDSETREEAIRKWRERAARVEADRSAALQERDARIRQRREAIERDRLLAEMRSDGYGSGGVGASKKKKKKKRK
jgi:putative transcription antitermination factor YqgF